MNAQFTLKDIANYVNAIIKNGDENQLISGVATLENATAQQVSFLSNKKYKADLETTQAGAVLLTEADAEDYAGCCLITNNPYVGFAKLSQKFDPAPVISASIHASAVISEQATLGKEVFIGAGAVIEAGAVIGDHCMIQANAYIGQNVSIGTHTLVQANAVIHHDCVVGHNVRIHSGVIIGAEGFGFAPEFTAEHQQWHRIVQNGRVIIGDDVRIGANTCIDRGALDDTVIGKGVILDNLIQIGHNVTIGDYTAIAAHTAIAGSTHIGKHCILGGCVAIAGHLTIVDRVNLMGATTITKSVLEAGSYSSCLSFADTVHWRKTAVLVRQLPDLDLHRIAPRFEELEAQIEQLSQQINPSVAVLTVETPTLQG